MIYDDLPIKHGDFPIACFFLLEGNYQLDGGMYSEMFFSLTDIDNDWISVANLLLVIDTSHL